MNKTLKKFPVLKDFKNPVVLWGLFLYVILTLLLTVLIGNFWAAISFAFAAYAVIGNDAVQTLMTYIHSNNDVKRKYLFVWVAIVLLGVIWYGYLTAGDITYGRLDAKGYVNMNVEWYVIFFPLILVFLTRFRGIPVSTSLLMLSIFSSTLLFEKIVIKSAFGYLVAFFSSFFLWITVEYVLKNISKKKGKVVDALWIGVKSFIASSVIIVWLKFALIPFLLTTFSNILIPEISLFQYFLYGFVIFLFILGTMYQARTNDKSTRSSLFWRGSQTFTTILLFSTWLMHDMVNIAVFLPSGFGLDIMLLISALFLLGLSYTFYIHGWPVGTIVTQKTTTNEIVAATMIDLVYFVILLIFKEWSNIPMSTTWVFVWLLAGRQLAIRSINRVWVVDKNNRFRVAFTEIWKDFSKIMVGLGISLVALIIVRYMTGT